MNAHERLRRGRDAALEGNYTLALSDYEWFHEHALADDPALRGVRRSFALSYWAELGSQFLPARTALIQLREKKINALLADAKDAGVFGDLVAIDHYLEDEPATYRVFLALRERDPQFAHDCSRIALPAIVSARDFQLARSYIPDPEAAIATLLDSFNEAAARAEKLPEKRRRKMRLEGETANFVSDVKLVLEVVSHADGSELYASLFRAALSGLSSDALRKRISRKLRAA